MMLQCRVAPYPHATVERKVSHHLTAMASTITPTYPQSLDGRSCVTCDKQVDCEPMASDFIVVGP